jgi:hypothetical protein
MRASRRRLAIAIAPFLLAACARSEGTTDSAGGTAAQRAALDTAQPLGATPAAGGIAKVTPTDAGTVRRATEFRLTEDNFRRFVQASESLSVLRARDPQVRAYLEQEINDAGAGTRVSTTNAGRKYLELNPAVNDAIVAAGLSARDYFVAAVAIAQAERFMGNPKAAPPTPVLGPNAEFLNAHKAELDRLRARERGGAQAAP